MKLTERLKQTAMLRAFGLAKIPLLFWVSPSVEEIDDERVAIRIPLGYRTKNHLGAMYFGVLAAGADCAGGLMAMRLIQKSGEPVSLVFKDFKAEFLRRAEDDVVFECVQGAEIREFVQKVIASRERMNFTVKITARLARPKKDEDRAPIAHFELTLSLKNKKAA